MDTSKDVDISGGPNNKHLNLSTTQTVFSGEKPNKNVELVVGPNNKRSNLSTTDFSGEKPNKNEALPLKSGRWALALVLAKAWCPALVSQAALELL